MNKILISSVAAAVLATVSGSALAASAVDVTTADQTVGDEEAANLTAPESKYPYGISAFSGFGISLSNPVINITAATEREGGEANGIWNTPTETGALVTVGSDSSAVTINASAPVVSRGIFAGNAKGSDIVVNGTSLTIDATSTAGEADGIVAVNGSTVTVNSGTIDVTAKGVNAWAVNAAGATNATPGTIVLGGDTSATMLNATATNGKAYGIFAGSKAGSTVTVNGKSLTINSHSDTDDAYGLFAQSSVTPDYEGDVSTININAEDTVINVTSGAGESHQYGIIALSNSRVNVNGNLTVNAGTGDAILTRGGSVITINPNKDKTVKLTGDINFNYNEAGSGTSADSTVNLNLSNADSFWTGNAVLTNGGASETSSGTVTGLTLSLSNGGTWNVANTAAATETTTPLAINNLSLNNGTVNFTDASQTAKIENLSGTGGQVNAAVEKNADGTYKTSTLSSSTVDTSSGTPTLTMNMVGTNGTTVNSDVISASELAALTSAAVTGALATETTRVATVAEGDVNGALTITENTDGTTTVAAPVRNTKLDSLQSIGAISMTLLRHDLNNLTKRMGELRDAPKGVGAWARVYGSKLSYGDNGLTSKNNSVQVGVDTDIAQTGWKVGGAFIYTNGKADYTGGDGDMDAYSIAAYGTWFGSNGVYVDLIGKYTRMSTDYEFGNMKGGYDNNAFTVSAETGWHKDLGQYAFVEPQAELTYGTVGGADDTASNGVKIDQSDYNSLIARIGVRAGAKFAENKGRIYARVSGNYDFLGDLKMSAQNASARSNLKDDLGGFWVEYGVGANFSFTKNTYGYVDFERTSGGEVDERYRWNVGIRHTF